MRTHKKVIKWIMIFIILLSYLVVVIEFKLYPEIENRVLSLLSFLSGKRQYFVSVLHGMLASLIISLGIEIINYFASKEETIRDFIAKVCEINLIFKKLSKEIESSNRGKEVVRICEEIRNINIYDFKLCI